ncbi:MAG: flagellar biosynthesis repressor FlbT [Methylocystis sp.]|nr:MAG: flagellar biosynthesis repressor FlbT [Methylocystis sp.]
MNISLRRGERIFINGAVIRVDRKVCLELMNDVTFLLENHVMQQQDASTPLKRLYFAIQATLIAPNDCEAALDLCRDLLGSLRTASRHPGISSGLSLTTGYVNEGRMFEALKSVRALFPLEQALPGESLASREHA